MKALALVVCAGMAAAGCSTEPPATRVEAHHVDDPRATDHAELTVAGWVVETVPTTTTSTTVPEPVTATTEAPYVAPVTTRRTATTVAYVEPASPQSRTVRQGDDFWYRLAVCENGGSLDNAFQFMGGTAEKVGYYPGASYAEQVAMAQDWAARIHPREGTSAGWPVCWAVAAGGGS